MKALLKISPAVVGALAAASILVFLASFSAADPATSSPAPVILESNSLYNGEDISAAPFAASSWGAGEVDTVKYTGLAPDKRAIKITTYGPYQGALLTFNTPGLLGNIKSDKTRFLDVTLALVPPPNTGGSDAYVPTSLFRLAQLPGNPGNPSPGSTTTPAPVTLPPSIQSLRIVFNLTNGVSVDTIRNLPAADPGNPWIHVGIPLSTLPLTDAQIQGAQLKSLMIAGDRTGTIYISKLTLLSDTTPIRAAIEGSRDVDRNSSMMYTSHATGGASNLTYTWKFGDDGSTPTGSTVYHTFTKSGDFKVSVTVLDADNLKPGVMVTTSVHVEAE